MYFIEGNVVILTMNLLTIHLQVREVNMNLNVHLHLYPALIVRFTVGDFVNQSWNLIQKFVLIYLVVMETKVRIYHLISNEKKNSVQNLKLQFLFCNFYPITIF